MNRLKIKFTIFLLLMAALCEAAYSQVTATREQNLPQVKLTDLSKLTGGPAGSPAITGVTDDEPDKSAHIGLTVFNLGDCPGVYVWTGTQWEKPEESCMNIWAGSNVYFKPDNPDGTAGSLTFDEVPDGHEGYQGLYFKWGSLIGVAAVPGEMLTDSTCLYIPDLSTGKYYKMPVSDVTSLYGDGYSVVSRAVRAFRAKLLTDADMSYGGSADWAKIPYVTTGNTDDRAANYLLSVHSPSEYKGDICKFLSDTKATSNNGLTQDWRMPVSNEFGAGSYTDNTYPATSFQMSTPDGTGTNNVAFVTFTYKSTGETVGFPAAGGRSSIEGRLEQSGEWGYYWSSSVYDARGAYGLSFNRGSVYPISFGVIRSLGIGVRCVRKH